MIIWANSGDELGIPRSDPEISVKWGIKDPIISDKDAKFSKLADLPRELFPPYESK